jgi:hypothetical protein
MFVEQEVAHEAAARAVHPLDDPDAALHREFSVVPR